jgi:hypothetical protein
MNQNKQKYISFIIVILLIVAGVFFFKSKDAVAPTDNLSTETSDPLATEDTPTAVKPLEDALADTDTDVDTANNLTPAQQALLAKLKTAVDARDFESFASELLNVYKKGWAGVSEFTALESSLYVYATDTYFVKGDLENSLRVSTIVYDKVPEAWRFRYLRIVTLEKYGRNALNSGDLVKAEEYAMQILQMMFRPEGANLMGDVYIAKINADIMAGNTEQAKQNLGYIWDYEVSADRRATLTALKTELGL